MTLFAWFEVRQAQRRKSRLSNPLSHIVLSVELPFFTPESP